MGTQRILKDNADIFMTWRIREKTEKYYDDIKPYVKALLYFSAYPAPWKWGTCA